MLTFRAGAAGSRASAQSMSDYLLEVRAIAERVGLSEYYSGMTGMAREDIAESVAERLGIATDRPVSGEELANLLAGFRTDGAEIEGRAKQAKIAYYDLTFSAPKHLSIAIAFAPTEQERAKLDKAHTDAVHSAMGYIESQVAHARRGDSGKQGSEAGKIAWLTFEDFTARPTVMIADGADTYIAHDRVPGDPQRHTHVIVPSMILTDSGHVGSIHGRTAIGGRVHEFGKIYQAHLATNLRRLGVDAVLDQETGMAKIASVPRRAVELFSKRTVSGETAARAWAARQGQDWDAMSDAARVALIKGATSLARRGKDGTALHDGMPDKEVWEQQAKADGYQHRSVLRPGEEREPLDARERREAAYNVSLPRLEAQLAKRSKFEGAVAREAAVEGLIEHGIVDTGSDIYAITHAYRTEGVLQEGGTTALRWGRDIVRDEETGEIRTARFASFTTETHIKQEQEVVGLLREAGNDRTGVLTREEIEAAARRVAARTGFELSPEQTEAALHLGTSGRAAALVGVAGAGKTALFGVLNEAWHEQGARIVGITRAWRQTQGLTDAGADHTHSIRQFLVGMAAGTFRYGKQHIVVLDEASQVGTRDLLEIARLQQQHGFRLAAIGDHKQGGSIEAGHAIRLFELALGENRVPELTWSRRQERQRDRETALMFRSGRAAEALQRKRNDGTLAIVPGAYSDAVRAVVDLWELRRAEAPDRTVGISAPTNADAMAISTEIRKREQARGAIGPDRMTLEAIDQRGASYDLPLAPGDRVRLFQRVRGDFGSRGGIVGNNGSVVTVEGVNDQGAHLRTRQGRVAWVEWGKLRDAETGRVKLAYGDALTIDSRQGDTLDEHITALPAGSRAIHGLQAYVAASRHRHREWFVISQGEEMRDIEARRPIGDPRSATENREASILENMAHNFRRQPEKTLATDFLARARGIGEGTIKAARAFWHRPEQVVERQASEAIKEAAQQIEQQQEAVQEVAEWRARSNLEFHASQVAQGWLDYEDVVDYAYALRLERVKQAGVVDIDYDLIREKAQDDVTNAIDRYDAAHEPAPPRDDGLER